MLARTFSAMLVGLKPLKIEVEVDGNRGTPQLIFIGLTSKATGEAKDRITAALQNCGIRIRSKRTIVNLGPADVPKTSSAFDLAIAVGILRMYRELRQPTDRTLFLGELALDGSIKKVHGALALALAAKELGFQKLVFPTANANELRFVKGIALYPISHLRGYLDWDKGIASLQQLLPQSFVSERGKTSVTFDDIIGQEAAKRVLAIAAAGGHHLLFTGPPGAGKSLLSQTLPALLPPLTEAEANEVTRIHSICGYAVDGLISQRPFRNPHHTTSRAGLIGGGANLHPGEITLAHRGVLFLDEFLEFSSFALEALRQPLEQQSITLIRSQGTFTYPAAFCLIAATNPCPCGYLGSTHTPCTCQPQALAQYKKKLSGPLLDRFDLKVYVKEVAQTALAGEKGLSSTGHSFTEVKAQVFNAQKIQAERFKGTSIINNAGIPGNLVEKYCNLLPSAKQMLMDYHAKLNLSMRGYHKMIKVARTIADLAGSREINELHMGEALQYRG